MNDKRLSAQQARAASHKAAVERRRVAELVIDWDEQIASIRMFLDALHSRKTS